MNIWSDEDQSDTARLRAVQFLIHSNRSSWKIDSLLYLVEEMHEFAKSSNKKYYEAYALSHKGSFNSEKGQFSSALNYFQQSIEVYESINDKRGIADIYRRMAEVLNDQTKFLSALQYLEKSQAICHELNDKYLIARNHMVFGLVFYYQGYYAKARASYYESLKIFEELNDQLYIVSVKDNISTTIGFQGQYKKAIEQKMRFIDYYRETNNLYDLSYTYRIIGLFFGKMGDYTNALYYTNEGIRISEEIGQEDHIAFLRLNRGGFYLELGNYAKAFVDFEQSLQTFKKVDRKDLIAICLDQIGLLYFHLENYKLSMDYFNQSLDILLKLDSKAYISDVYNHIGKLNDKLGKGSLAQDYYQKSLAINIEIGKINAQSDNFHDIGVSLKEQGNYKGAFDYFQKSKKIREELGDSKGNAEIYLEIGDLKLREGDVNSAKIWCEKGYNLVRELGTLRLEKDACDCLYLVNKKLGNGDLALAYYERSYRLEDSLKTDEASKQLQQMEFDRQRTVDSLARVEDNLKSELAFQGKLSNEKNARNTFMFAGLAILLISGGLLSRMLYIRRTNKELKKKNAIIALEKERAEESERAKEQFFDNVSHEFRTPLTLILGPLDEAIQSTTDQDVKPNLEIMQRNATRLAGMINELLDLSKLEFGKVKLQAKEENIVKLTEEFLQSFESLADQKKIKLSFKSRAKEYLVWIDADQIRKILANLLSNAFKFTSAGGEVKLSIVSIANPRDLRKTDHIHTSGIILKISDTGIGIPEEKLPNIFDRFYQVGDSTQSHHTGTGIGLALTRELVELHHGTINVSSKPGKGTTFSIFIPFGKEHISDDEMVEEALTEVEMPEKESALESETEDRIETGEAAPEAEMRVDHEDLVILIAEDNPDMRTYIRSQLEKNYAILEAKDGEEGLQRAFEAIPDLIISDVMMPVMDGYEMTERLKTDQRTSHIPVIILTARAAIESKIEGLETGADAYITKPFNAKELQVRVIKLIEQRRKLHERFSRKLDQRIEIKVDQSLVSMEERFLQKALEVVNANISDTDFDSQAFASEMALSRVQLHRKIKALTNKTTSEFIRTIRLNKAAELLKQQSDM